MASNITDIAEANKKIDELEKTHEDLKAKAAESADLSKYTDEQIAKALEHPGIWKTKRLSELRDKAKKVEDLEKQVNDLKDKQGTPDDQVQKLREEIDSLKTENKESKISQAITAAAVKAGVKNPSVIAKLIDRQGLEIDATGNVNGVDEQISGLLQSDPYLKGDTKTTNVGNPSNPNPDDQGGKKLFKASEIKDPAFYRSHEKEIDLAIAQGAIEDDLATTA